MTILVKDKATQEHMAVVVAKPTDRAIMILRMEAIYRALPNLAKDEGGRRRGKGSCTRGSMRVTILCLGGLIETMENRINA